MPEESLTDRDRFPLMNAAGHQMLNRLRQHRAAPRYNYHCGEKLSAAGLARVKRVAQFVRETPTRWRPDQTPDWLPDFVHHCYTDVPFYREREFHPDSRDFDISQIPLIDRHDLRKRPWLFVPDSAVLDELVVYRTSGTTGNFLSVICNPDAPASYLPLIEFAAGQAGAKIDGGARVSIMHVAAQKSTFTHCSVMSYFNSAGFVKLNLHPDEWTHPQDRVAFIDDCDAEIYTGDPFAFVEMMKLPLTTKPNAIISSATRLLPAIKQQLESHFECPVIDMISTNETGPLGFGGDGRHHLFPHRLFIEIVDDSGSSLPPGQRGEIVVSGGINAMMPLLRYRTGDYAALEFENDCPLLADYAGRTPVVFYRADGEPVRSIDVVVNLYRIPLSVFRLHQNADGQLRFLTRCDPVVQRDVELNLRQLFDDSPLVIEQLEDAELWQGKAIQFSSEYQT